MQHTNRYGLPRPIYDAIRDGGYDHPDGLSASTLISPPYQRRLISEFNNELSADVSTQLYALLGTSVHYILEKAGTDIIKELRVYGEIDGEKISAKGDYYDPVECEILDIKVTTKYATKYGKAKPEWVQQLNILAYLYRKIGLRVRKVGILAILRDWMQPDKYKHDYTDIPFHRIDIPLWTMEEAENYLIERVKAHKAAMTLPISLVPICSPEERWRAEDIYAVMKKGADRATKLCDTYDEAVAYCSTKGYSLTGSAYSIVTRPAVDKRCTDYCIAKTHCSYAIGQGY